jgi:multicomponent Na+:H+ antiporter subunit D
MLPWMQRTLTISLDIDWLYRKALPKVSEMIISILSVAGVYFGTRGQKITGILSDCVMRLYGPHGALSREIQTGFVVLLVVLMLGLYLLLYLITI